MSPDPVREETGGGALLRVVLDAMDEVALPQVGRAVAATQIVKRLEEHLAASASSLKEEGGGEVWSCPGCGTEYTSDVGECGQRQPWECRERVVSSATWRAAKAVALANNDGTFQDLDAARATRDLSGDDNYADEVCSGAEDRVHYCKLATAALGTAAPSVFQQETGERGDLTLKDSDGDALVLRSCSDGRVVAKTVHAGRPDSTRVLLSVEDQQRAAAYLASVSFSQREGGGS